MSSSTLRKIAGFLAATAMGILGGELFFTALLVLKGASLAQIPFWSIAKLDWIFAALAVAPWLVLDRSEGHRTIWSISLLLGGGFGVICGAMSALLVHDLQFLDVAVLVFGGMGLSSAVAAATFAHSTGLFGTREQA
ncbi:MAG TPA: hypothetical protein V6D22_25880 [Candidatus Obscuribacterales bacterium]